MEQGGGWREEGEVCRGGRMSMMDRAREAKRGPGTMQLIHTVSLDHDLKILPLEPGVMIRPHRRRTPVAIGNLRSENAASCPTRPIRRSLSRCALILYNLDKKRKPYEALRSSWNLRMARAIWLCGGSAAVPPERRRPTAANAVA